MTAAGASRREAAAPSVVAAVSTSYPSRLRIVLRISSWRGSSSTTRTRSGSIVVGSPRSGGVLRRRRRLRTLGRNLDPEGRSGARRALHLDLAAVVLDDPLGDRQPQADPRLARREERLEDPFEVGGGDAGAGVAEDDRRRRHPPGRAARRGLHLQPAARRRRLDRVDDDVEEAGPQPLRVGLDRWEVGTDPPHDLDPLLLRLGRRQRQDLVQDLVDPAGTERQPRRTTVAQEIAHHPVEPGQLAAYRGY